MTRAGRWLCGLAIVWLLLAAMSLCVGPVSITPSHVWAALFGTVPEGALPMQTTIIRDLRLPRILLASIVGLGLGASGAGFQGLFRNPLADPFVIGASSGAALGATIGIVTGVSTSFGTVGLIGCALVGALLAVGLAYGIATAGRTIPTVSLLLAGVTLSSLFGACVSLLMILNASQLSTIFSWLMGRFSGLGWPVLIVAGPMAVIGSGGLWLCSRGLDALTFGDETAQSLGVSLGRHRLLVVVAASLATAASVAAAGIIGFVGLIAPHMARPLVGARHAVVIPAAGLIGAILLLVSDGIARIVIAPVELPVGIITALLGSPFFLYLLRRLPR